MTKNKEEFDWVDEWDRDLVPEAEYVPGDSTWVEEWVQRQGFDIPQGVFIPQEAFDRIIEILVAANKVWGLMDKDDNMGTMESYILKLNNELFPFVEKEDAA